jgi:hypothetical protein
MPKKILTQEDIDLNPELAEQGFKAGDEVDIPDEENVTSGTNNSNDDTGGSNPPPDKERPDKP